MEGGDSGEVLADDQSMDIFSPLQSAFLILALFLEKAKEVRFF